MKTSARNQFSGVISHLQQGSINDEVELSLASGAKIFIMITHASSNRLNLANGSPAIALVKASSVILADASDDVMYSARNQLSGTVSSVKAGAVNSEVVIKIADSVEIVAIITNESAHDMALIKGKLVLALFKASSVMLAVQKS